MARSRHYTRWRQILMQFTLCAILGATLGLAMLVSQRKMTVKLTTSRNAENIWAMLPYGWVLEEESRPPVVFQVREPGAHHGGRRMTIRSEEQTPGTSVLQYLRESSLLQGTMEVLGADEPLTVTIAGSPGLLVQRKRPLEVEPDMSTMYATVWVAATVLPSGQAVSIELDCSVELDAEADRKLVSDVGAGISVTDHAR